MSDVAVLRCNVAHNVAAKAKIMHPDTRPTFELRVDGHVRERSIPHSSGLSNVW